MIRLLIKPIAFVQFNQVDCINPQEANQLISNNNQIINIHSFGIRNSNKSEIENGPDNATNQS